MPLVPPKSARPPREAHRIDEASLARWLAANVEACRGGGAVTALQFQGGQSNPTYWIGFSGPEGDMELVLRKKPPGELLPSAHAVEREYRVMRALAGSDVPVPETLALCEDPAVIGTPFFVMRHVPGRIFWDPQLPGTSGPDERRAIYDDLVRALAALHRVEYATVGLGDYGKVGGFVPRQVQRWSRQYEASRTGDVPAMEALMAFLGKSAPKHDETTLVHGDYRIDNVIFAANEPRALAIIDWELSTLGHPVSDLAYLCMGYHLALPGRGSLVGADFGALGIPDEKGIVEMYCKLTGRGEIEDWPYFMAFGIFRLAAIAQGVYKRSLQGNASSESAGAFGAAVFALADLGCNIAGVRPG
ncbi:phosphotransferase family protein [Polyangium sp. 6x1]|uniref:phosphotransferase family protein n=1 Tax=Polyangium sp. 6x1 TaxID=3042689 RepID=UPI002482BE9E|nr:phosphotransferase family protein [Polyangium sp. 6x1]MDI1447779.1 phosphotransferase family protein [Polyangium sp. 6x1]